MKNSEKKQYFWLKTAFFILLALNIALTAVYVYAFTLALNSGKGSESQENAQDQVEETSVEADAKPIEDEPEPTGPVRLHIVSVPSGAKLFVNGYYKGKSPVDVEIYSSSPGGEYTISLLHPGYLQFKKNVFLAQGQEYSYSFELSKE